MATHWAHENNEEHRRFLLIDDCGGNAMARVVSSVEPDLVGIKRVWTVYDVHGDIRGDYEKAEEARAAAIDLYDDACERAYQSGIEGQNS